MVWTIGGRMVYSNIRAIKHMLNSSSKSYTQIKEIIMGGKNHAPCNKYLELSTRLSRYLSLAHAQLELANVALEDVLLQELNNGVGFLTTIEDRLTESRQSLDGSLKILDTLKSEMRANRYADLPPLHKLDLSTIGEKLSREGIINIGAWNSVLHIFKQKTFYGVIEHFIAEIRKLQGLTDNLLGDCVVLTKDFENGHINVVLEQNHEGNIKPSFGKLYTAWLHFDQEFLASSLISTEIWYHYSEYGSLLDNTKVHHSSLVFKN